MSSLAFYPWLQLAEHPRIGRFQLVPYQRAVAPGGAEQDAIDGVLEPYLETARPIRQATLIRVGQTKLTGQLNLRDRRELFLFNELLAFSALARRELFSLAPYFNRHHFILYIQDFTEPRGSIALETRRRDGVTKGLINRKAHIVRRPPYVHGDRVPLDLPLLRALHRVRWRGVTRGLWPAYHDALYCFNHANTDSDVFPEIMDVILMYNAFERLLGCDSAKYHEHCMAKNLPALWRPTKDLPLARCLPILPAKRSQYKTVREAWIRDFYRLRGELAHGKRHPGRKLFWTPTEHVVLGAFAFPRLVKARLARDGFYTLTDKDQDDLDLLEPLLCARGLLKPTKKRRSSLGDFTWNRVVSEQFTARIGRRIAAQMRAAG